MNFSESEINKQVNDAFLFSNSRENLYQLAIEGTNDGLWYYNFRNDSVYLSQRALEILGYEKNRIFTGNEAFNHLLSSETGPAVKEKMVSHINGHSFNYDEVLKLRTSTGDWKWLRVRGKMAARDTENNLTGLAGTYEDVTEKKKSEEELEKSRNEFRSYFDSTNVGISINSLDKYWLIVNKELCRMLGYTREELMQKTWEELTHPDDISKSLDFFHNARSEKIDNYSFDKRYIRKDGGILYCTLFVLCRRNKDGSIYQTIGTLIDNTARHLSEEKEKQKHHLLRTLIDNLPFNIYVLDKNGRKIISNQLDFSGIGYEREEEVIGKTVKDLYPGGVGEKLHAENLEILRTGQKITNLERYYVDKTGKRTLKLVTKIPLFDESGISGLIGFFNDITSIRELELKNKESEEYFRTLIDISPYGIVITDIEGYPTYVSKKAFEIFNIPEQIDLKNFWIFNFIIPEDRERSINTFRETVSQEQISRKWEYRCTRYDDSVFWAEVISSAVKDASGKISGLMIVFHDISERKKAEQELISAKEKAEQSDRLKTALLHNISHEIRTPLNAILGFSELITDAGNSDETRASYSEIIKSNSDQLLSIINDLVDMSSIQAKIVSRKETEVNINDILAGIYNRFRKKAEENNITLSIIPGYAGDLKILTDQSKLLQVISNLVSNSLKFTWRGEVNIGYLVKDSVIEFFISDTGIGIHSKYHSNIFEPFFQVQNSLNRQYEGTGMGLAICSAYVGLLGGKMWLTSDPGKGSVFYFTIPFIHANGDKAVAGCSDQPAFPAGLTVLVAEDLDFNLRYLSDLLTKLGVKVIKALNGKEASDICLENTVIDIVLMDLKMPVMDGFQALQIIRKVHPDIPVIAQSAYITEKDDAIRAGFNDFISKPFTRKQVISVIRRHVWSGELRD